MFAVGRLGSYISRGVYTVSGPFHPFGGAVDIVVVEQPDGTFKSSPWYVRFGKFQGVLKASEKVVSINVNGVDADFNMYLDNKGEAFFLREVDAVEGELESYVSSGDETDVKADLWQNRKSKSCNFDSNRTDLVSELETRNGKILARNNSRRGRVFGLSFGRRSMKENGFQGGERGAEVDRASSMERAEIAADLLEVRWTTNLRGGAPRVSPSKSTVSERVSKVIVEDGFDKNDSLFYDDGTKVDSSVSHEGIKKTDAEVPTSTNPENYMEIYSLEETYMRVNLNSGTSLFSNRVDNGSINDGKDAQSEFSQVSMSGAEVSKTADNEETEGSIATCEDHSSAGSSFQGERITGTKGGINKLELPLSCDCGGESGLYSTAGAHLADKVGTTPLPGTSKGLLEDVILMGGEEVSPSTALNMENPASVEPCNYLNGSTNERTPDDISTVTSDFHSLALITEKEGYPADVEKQLSFGAEERLEDSTKDITNAALSDNSEDDQFCFSDLDRPKVDKDEQTETSSPDSKEYLPRDSLSSEDEVTETYVSDDNLHQSSDKVIQGDLLTNHPSPKVNSNSVSSPISILKLHKDAGEQKVVPVADSLPNMMFTSDDLDSYGAPQLLSRSLDSNLEAIKIVNDVLATSELDAVQQQAEHVQLRPDSSQISEETKKIISDPAVELSLCRHLLYEGMGYEAAALAFDAEKLNIDKSSSLGADIVKNDKLVVRIGGLYFPWDAALPIASAIGSPGNEQILEPKGMIAVGVVDNKTSGVPQKSMNSRSGSWKLWPFSFKKSNSMQGKNLDSEISSVTPEEKLGNTDYVEPKFTKKKIRVKAPSSEQLASLNLKEGKNVVTFTFSTAMLGKQQVDARIFLWKWNTRIVISDVDGTITKSDVLGQFMPLMGIDWSQTGVTHLFSAIKENGYQLLFLSARSISQAYHTRQFLFNLKQDGKELPEGPVLISPDGLFPSLYREVIRRAPHEFKISCLEDIKALFPRDHNPFYAGFGNRDTDEISYLKVGIPIGKIFIINPKGQIAVNRRVDTKSYSCFHALVHGMFPPTPVTEQEDYNSWNFWRLPPSDVAI